MSVKARLLRLEHLVRERRKAPAWPPREEWTEEHVERWRAVARRFREQALAATCPGLVRQ